MVPFVHFPNRSIDLPPSELDEIVMEVDSNFECDPSLFIATYFIRCVGTAARESACIYNFL